MQWLLGIKDLYQYVTVLIHCHLVQETSEAALGTRAEKRLFYLSDSALTCGPELFFSEVEMFCGVLFPTVAELLESVLESGEKVEE